ncbi:DegT/DnrJ/EryC1/StrS aminotransferase family protein [Bacillus cereus group sp. BfR-BA-01380]|uniref:DegT/DnrJ/EryC1/StrS family aminotransferase n=1 Tax=Bacillus cereus group sp. BfR-BA-01380 TaxID=2920324 RepID=UPI001F56A7A7|nr:DegT/DnrJ/EryC1/StrS family aminotransferase [Bacillus cereus group sp. BfR-BA-01380]
MSIQLFVPHFEIDECLEEIRLCLEKGWTGLGYKTVEFENEWKRYTGLPNAHFINSATVGLHLAVKILKMVHNWNDGDEIISTPLTFVSTNHAIVYENMNVVFADVDQYLCLDPKDIEKKITNKTRAIMYVGLGGSTGQYKEILSLCNQYNLRLIVDAAHMSGTRLDGEIPGKEADVMVYSFQAVKNLPTADSGMICFKDDQCDSLCRKLTWLGINKDTFERVGDKGSYKWRYDVEYLGYKYHGNSIMAAIGLVQLRYLDQNNAYRRQIAQWYNQKFLHHPEKLKRIPIPAGCESSNHLYIIEVKNRDELLLALNQVNIYPGVHYRDNTNYNLYAYAQGTCPNSHRVSEHILSLPIHMKLSKTDVDYVCEQVIKYAKG